MIQLYNYTGRRIIEKPIPSSDGWMGGRYCAGAGQPDEEPPPKGSRASRLKAEAIVERIDHGHGFRAACTAEMLTLRAGETVLRREGFAEYVPATKPGLVGWQVMRYQQGKQNRERVYEALRELGEANRHAVAQRLGLSISGVQPHLVGLCEEGRATRRERGRAVVYEAVEGEGG